MQKLLSLVVITFLGVISFAKSQSNVNSEGVMLGRNDPVSYFKLNKPIKGDSKFQAKVGEETYWFANEENKALFLKDPKKYEPEFGGWCAYAVSTSKSKVEVDLNNYLIQDGRLLFFYKRAGFFSKDTRDDWLHTKSKDAKIYLKDADANWPETKIKEP
jgi:YHS domain-containing protein